MGRIFISYRRSDAGALAGRIYDAMAARFGRKQVFRDTEDIPVGARFPEFLHKTLLQSQVAFILIGPTWLSAANPDGTRRLDDPTDLVRLEVETALKRGLLVCPLLLDGAAMPAAEDLPPSIQEVHWHNALPIRSTPTEFAQDMARLATDIKRAVEGKGGTLVERFAIVGRTTAIPLAAGAAGVAVGATAAKGAGGGVGDLLAKGCSTVAAKVAAVAVATTAVVAVVHPALLPFGLGHGASPTPVGNCRPQITSITAFAAVATQQVMITGRCFGTTIAFSNADSPYVRISDTPSPSTPSSVWNACFSDNAETDQVTCSVSSWADQAITFTGFNGSYGQFGWTVSTGDTLSIQVWNPQTGHGPGMCTIVAGAPGTTHC
jgi:hypothetical protein